ncbi:MAG: methionyl-tRNA formyltransferase [Deltaproteobacteria bacterium]|nr:MAG: methionyl-tRNA formyltransferase [Deltaproteobacteria bacterium]
MGTPELAATVLQALLDGPHEVVGVVSQPDRPAGRGKHLVSPPVAALARERGIPLMQPEACKSAAFREDLAAWAPDVAVVAAFGHILGPKALAVPRLGCVNVHASLLPRWRGASPIQRAIEAGDAESGVSIMQMDPGMDTGPVLLERRLALTPDETADTLHDRLAALGAEAIGVALDALEAGTATATPQPELGVTHAPKITKADGVLDWARPAVVLDRQVRAFHPWPGTGTTLDGRVLKVLPPISPLEGGADAAPGTVLAVGPDGIDVACGEGSLRLTRLQLAGKKALDAAQFLAGHRLVPGMVLGADASTES